MRTAATTLLSAIALVALPGATAIAAPGAVEEYALDIPSSGDDRRPEPGAAPAGEEAAAPAAAPAGPAPTSPQAKPARDRPERDRDRREAAAEFATPPPDEGGSAAADVLGALTSDSGSGSGPLLPIVLGLTLAGALAAVIARRRGSQGSDGPQR